MNNHLKNSLWNTIGATANAFTSLIFTIIATRVNSESDAGLFSYAFATAAILFVIGNFVIRPFQVTDISERFADSDYVCFRLLSCGAMLVAAIGFCLIMGYSAHKSAVIILLAVFRMVEAFYETFYAVTQRAEMLYRVGISMTIKAAADVAVFAAADILTHSLPLAIAAMTAVNLILFVAIDIKDVRRAGFVRRPFTAKAAKALFLSCFFTFVLTFLNTYLINVSRYAIDADGDDKTQLIFGIIIIPATFMCLLGQYIIQPSLTSISAAIKSCDFGTLRKTVVKVTAAIPVIGAAVFVVAFFLEAPVLQLVYGIPLEKYKTEMLIIIAGSVMYGLEVVVSYILIAFRRTASQAVVFAAVSVAATAAAYRAVRTDGLMGAAAVYAVSMTVLAAVLVALLLLAMLKYRKQWNTPK